MNKKSSSKNNSFWRVLLAGLLVFTLVFSHSDTALAARSGGRIGGSQFRSRPAPGRTYSAPSRGYPAPVYPGGGFGFPFFIPFFGVGGGFGGLFTILIFIAIANFLVSAFRRAASGDEISYGDVANPPVSLNLLQVGLLAEARYLQPELNQIAAAADTGSTGGLTLVLQETTLALLRHPEFWVYASTQSQQGRLQAAEAEFNRLALAERSKLSAETLSNVNQQLRQTETRSLPETEQAGQLVTQGPGEYIVVSLLVASQGKLNLPKVNSAEDLRQALRVLGSVSSDQLLALEVLWTPQAEGDTLTSEDVITAYPNLKVV